MSHFSVMVIGEDYVDQLAKFNEDIEMPRYVKYTKAQLIEQKRKEIEDYKNGIYAEYLKDREAYACSCRNMKHLDYVRNEFPKSLKWKEPRLYEEAIKCYSPEEIGLEGEVYTTENPNSKWDWYVVGGRWAGMLKLKDGIVGIPPNFSYGWEEKEKKKIIDANMVDIARKSQISNIDNITCFVFLKDGVWHEKGEMGWFACVTDEKTDWEDQFKKLVRELPEDSLITIVDCHI